MNENFKIPPKSIDLLTQPAVLAENLSVLVGAHFLLSGKTRTDGSRMRNLIAGTLENFLLPEPSNPEDYEIVPPRKKGVPKILLEFIDTYLVTSGTSYNLQVWNRIPASNSLIIRYESGESLQCLDVRFVLVKIDLVNSRIDTIVILSPDYIENKFGKFGKQTVKYQLLISSKARKAIYQSSSRILTFPDTKKLSYFVRHTYEPPKKNMMNEPVLGELLSISTLNIYVAEKLIGQKLDASATKNRGQALERKVMELLGYVVTEKDLLCGGYPDIRNQLLEVKVQDTQTVDLGKFSPEKEEKVFEGSDFTTFDVRYLIALTNPKTEIIEGIILAPGEKLGELFSYVSDKSFKCQRSIPMSFFNNFSGKSVFNPV